MTSAPYFFAISAYFSESVVTITLSKHLLLIAASIEYAINGLPHTLIIFLSFKPLDPERAGIIAIFFIISTTFYKSCHLK